MNGQNYLLFNSSTASGSHWCAQPVCGAETEAVNGHSLEQEGILRERRDRFEREVLQRTSSGTRGLRLASMMFNDV